MTDEIPAIPQQPGVPIRYKVMPVALIGVLLAMLHFGPGGEGYRHKPYRDVGGVWTVCGGLTGNIDPNHWYTDADCKRLETAFGEHMAQGIETCLDVPLSRGEWLAWGHWSWNVGTQAFCDSVAAERLNAGRYREACDAMMNFHRAGGRDCRIRANNCPGLIVRRNYERALCIAGGKP